MGLWDHLLLLLVLVSASTRSVTVHRWSLPTSRGVAFAALIVASSPRRLSASFSFFSMPSIAARYFGGLQEGT